MEQITNNNKKNASPCFMPFTSANPFPITNRRKTQPPFQRETRVPTWNPRNQRPAVFPRDFCRKIQRNRFLCESSCSSNPKKPNWSKRLRVWNKNPNPKFRRVSRPKSCGPAPFAPRNTTSFLIRARKGGGIAVEESPSALTPGIPGLNPRRIEPSLGLAETEWGVDSYGSMKGVIRLKPFPDTDSFSELDHGTRSSSSSFSVGRFEKRLEHDLSRFEMINPSVFLNTAEDRAEGNGNNQIQYLQQENVILRRRLSRMQEDMEELQHRLLRLENESLPDAYSVQSVGSLDC